MWGKATRGEGCGSQGDAFLEGQLHRCPRLESVTQTRATALSCTLCGAPAASERGLMSPWKPRLTARRPCAAVSKALFQRAGFPLAPLAVAMGSTQETWALPSAASSLPQAGCLLGEFAGEGTKQAVWVLGRTSPSTVPGLLESGLCTSGPSDTGQESTVQGREEDTSDGGLCADESDLCLGFAALSAMHSRLQV